MLINSNSESKIVPLIYKLKNAYSEIGGEVSRLFVLSVRQLTVDMHAPATFIPAEKNQGVHWIGDCASHMAVTPLKMKEKSTRPFRNSNPNFNLLDIYTNISL